MRVRVRFSAFIALCLMLVACATSPTSPSPITTAPASESTPYHVPPLSGPSRTFIPVSDVVAGTTTSRLVVYDDGAFSLQFSLPSLNTGTYSNANGVLTFQFDARGSDSYTATGTLTGSSLAVRYNAALQLSDFPADVVYVQEP